MSRLDELITKLCPDGVEYKCLGDIGQVKMCKRILKSQTNTNGGVPFYKIGTFGGEANAFISEDLFRDYKEKYSYPKIGEILISAAGTIGRTVVYDGEPAYYQDSNIVWLAHDESNILNTFLRYCYELKPWNISSGGTIARLYNDNILKAKVPVPPLEVQREIVHILDRFTLLTAELTAELTARKKQYEFYRDSLLNFNVHGGATNDVVWKTLEEVCKNIISGGTPKAGNSEYYGGSIPWLRTQEVDWHDITDTNIKITEAGLNSSSAKWIPANCVIVAMYGATAAKVAVNKIPLTTNQACCNLEVDDKQVLYRYVFHWLCKEYLSLKALGQGSQSNINAQIIRQYKIPIPSLKVQRKIVSVLDNFEAICTDLHIGLPAEIEKRQQQYEYYRDLLLTYAATGTIIAQTDRQTDRAERN